jgi:hypothetical protein
MIPITISITHIGQLIKPNRFFVEPSSRNILLNYCPVCRDVNEQVCGTAAIKLNVLKIGIKLLRSGILIPPFYR